jgi:putative spermidine/putrescine transport system ATP-binding protein
MQTSVTATPRLLTVEPDKLDGPMPCSSKFMASPNVLVRFRAVDKSYDGLTKAISCLDLDILEGEFLTLLGPSGSGKTSTLMMLAGFEVPSEGQILFKGRELDTLPPHQRNFGVVFQDYALFPHMTVEQNLGYPLRFRSIYGAEKQKRIDDCLAMLQLTQFRRRYPRQLSGGQQQRVALGRALIFNPHLVLMDEPLGALDRQLRERMQMEIKHLHQQLGITIVSVTHDQGEALTMSDRIAVFRDGSLQQIGRPHELYENPANLFVARFIGDSNFLEGQVAAIHDRHCTVRCSDGSTLLATRVDCGPVGTAARVGIRPERIRFADASMAGAEWNQLEGIILEHVYLGDALRLRCRVADSDEFVMKIPVGGLSKVPAIGEAVPLAWSRSHSRAFAHGEP